MTSSRRCVRDDDVEVAEGTTIAAILTGTAAVLTAWAAVRRAGSKGNEECEEALAQTRTEAEAAQAEIHRLRMAHPEEIPKTHQEPHEE